MERAVVVGTGPPCAIRGSPRSAVVMVVAGCCRCLYCRRIDCVAVGSFGVVVAVVLVVVLLVAVLLVCVCCLRLLSQWFSFVAASLLLKQLLVGTRVDVGAVAVHLPRFMLYRC